MYSSKNTKEPSILDSLFYVNWFWTIIRLIGLVFASMVVFNFGPAAISNENTGGLLMDPNDGLVTFLFTIFLFAGLLLPFLTNFGLLEFFGTMMVKIMRPLFKSPGRSSVDALTSWVGDGTIGVLMTSKQYEMGNYTKKRVSYYCNQLLCCVYYFLYRRVRNSSLGALFYSILFNGCTLWDCASYRDASHLSTCEKGRYLY